MNKVSRAIYNSWTWFWHKILRAPIRLAVASDSKIKNADATVVFLHGISADSATWKKTLAVISKEKDFQKVRWVTLDLLGFGKSLKADWLSYDEECYNKALHKSLKKLKVTNKLIIVGHSMGSLIAANYAGNFSEHVEIDKLILVSPPVLMADELAKLPDKVYTKSYRSLHNFASNVPAAEAIAKLVQKFSSFRSDYIKTAAFQKSMENIILNHHNYRTFVGLRVPTVLIHGHFDPLVMGANLRRVAKHNSHYAKYISVIGYHDISVGKRVKIIMEIRKTLKEGQKNEVV